MTKKSFILLTILTFISLAILIALGTWQMKRLSWKEDLLAKRETQKTLPAITLPDHIETPEDFDFRSVTLEGEFIPEKAVKLIPRLHEGQSGANLIVPFKRKDGSTVLIDLGWVSNDFDLNNLDLLNENILGTARIPSPKARFQPENQLDDKLLFWVDLNEIQSELELENLQPLIIERKIGGTPLDHNNAPIPYQTEVVISNNHLQYALSWYALAITLIVIYGFYIRRHLNLKPDEDEIREKFKI